MTLSPFLRATLAGPRGGPSLPVCRLGLATRGDDRLTPDDVFHALDAGVNFLNWCGSPDALSQAVAALGGRREDVVVCVQLAARTAAEARDEFASTRAALGTDRVDVVTFYYVEEPAEWRQIVGPGGALEFVDAARRDGAVGLVGLTSHQRRLAAEAGRSGHLDLLMVRYNAAHTGAEKEVFPVAREEGLGVVVYTCLRWGALPRGTPDDPPGFAPPRPPAWYRFALQAPAVTVALAAPADRAELDEDLTALRAAGPLAPEEYAALVAHGDRVRRHAWNFP